jgi:hypothetical protein
MIWPFSLPPSIIKKNGIYRSLGMHSVDWAYSEYQHVFPINIDNYWLERDELDEWCQLNHCYHFIDRVFYDAWSKKRPWKSNGMGDMDLVFIATNWDTGAIMAKLRWGVFNGS